MLTYKGYTIEVKEAFRGFYATAYNPKLEDFSITAQPSDADRSLPASKTWGFDNKEDAVKEAKRLISQLLNRLEQGGWLTQ